MARMPQIPGVEYGARPAGNVEKTPLLPVDGGGEALKEGAGAIENFADARQKALDQKRDIVTNVAAIKAASDYSLAAGDTVGALQQKYAADPFNPKFRTEVEEALSQQAAAAASAISDEDTKGKVMGKFATINAQFRAQSENWADQQATVKTKSTVIQLEKTYGRQAANALSPQQLEHMLPTANSDLGQAYAAVTDNPAKALEATRVSMVKGWAETQSAEPHRAFAVLAAIADPKSIINRVGIKPDEIRTLEKRATASFEGGGVTAMVNSLATAHKDISSVLNLAVANDPKFMSASLAVRDKIQQDIVATTANTERIPAAARAERLKTLNTNAQIIDTLDMLYRSNPGVFQDKKADPKVTADILARAKEPWMKQDSGIGDHLKDLLELRRDAAAALQKGAITRTAYETVETKLQLAIPKSAAAQDTGRAVHYAGANFTFTTPIQAGNKRLTELLDGPSAIGNFSQDQKNAAWQNFYAKMNATHQGADGAGSATKETFRQWALDAAMEAQNGH